jgi:hypothetical protein
MHWGPTSRLGDIPPPLTCYDGTVVTGADPAGGDVDDRHLGRATVGGSVKGGDPDARLGSAGVAAVQQIALTARGWATVLKRVCEFVALACRCTDCGGRMQLIAVISDRAVIERTRAPRPLTRARPSTTSRSRAPRDRCPRVLLPHPYPVAHPAALCASFLHHAFRVPGGRCPHAHSPRPSPRVPCGRCPRGPPPRRRAARARRARRRDSPAPSRWDASIHRARAALRAGPPRARRTCWGTVPARVSRRSGRRRRAVTPTTCGPQRFSPAGVATSSLRRASLTPS